ncbi:hypothetical protein JCM33374_g2299 [Metschnikowia sp. JCM 33374]|nr:hypothetical protein JCM33374_g2299 [Metschnikowia sp. JCM 33374]
MIQVDLDKETSEFINHLRGLVNGEVSRDKTLANHFTDGIHRHKPSLYSKNSNFNFPYRPILHNLVSLLLRVIPNAPEYNDLFLTLLEPLPLDELLQYLPIQAILELSVSCDIEYFITVLLKENDSKNEFHNNESMVHLMTEHGLLYSLVTFIWESNQDTQELQYYVEGIIKDLSITHPGVICAEKFESLTSLTPEEILSPTRLTTHCSVLSMLTCIDLSHQPWAAKLFPFKFSNLLDLRQDEGALFDVAQIYAEWVGKVPFSWLKPFISDLFDYSIRYFPGRLADWDCNDCTESFQYIFQSLLGCRGKELEFALETLSRPYVQIVNKNLPDSYFFFARLPLKNIPDKETFFWDRFGDLDIKSGTDFVTHCMNALIADEEFFRLLVESKMLTSENLRCWNKDDIFRCFSKMTRNPLPPRKRGENISQQKASIHHNSSCKGLLKTPKDANLKGSLPVMAWGILETPWWYFDSTPGNVILLTILQMLQKSFDDGGVYGERVPGSILTLPILE